MDFDKILQGYTPGQTVMTQGNANLLKEMLWYIYPLSFYWQKLFTDYKLSMFNFLIKGWKSTILAFSGIFKRNLLCLRNTH